MAIERSGTSGLSRREALRLAGAAAVAAIVTGPGSEPSALTTRPIPSSGEELPVIGIGTWRTFDVGVSEAERRPLEDVLAAFARRGGRLVDSSPMYGRAEGVVGDLAAKLRLVDALFLATKVWTTGKDAGIAQMERSARLLRKTTLDLEQVHNLVDVGVHLPTLRAWKEQRRIRYVGISHYAASAYPDVEKILRRERVDFLQINYSVAEPEAGDRLLPLAADRGVAVIANRPFGGGGAIAAAAGKPLPDFAAALACGSWAQLFLKWILGNPAVTCAIPGTGKVAHLEDNLAAARGPLPDEALRRRIAEAARFVRR